MKHVTWGECAGAEKLAHELFTLPTHSFVTARDCEGIERLLSSSEYRDVIDATDET
jgi:hypothetical protein